MVSISQSNFGIFNDPQTGKAEDVIKYTLNNSKGLVVEILNYGAIIAAIKCPDNNGSVEDVVLGFDTFPG